MASAQKQFKSTTLSFRQFFRLIFLLFSLYLLRDAFFRWDGFSYYATFSEFLPSVALASIFWSIIAFLISILFWLLLRAIVWVCHCIGLKITIEHLVLYLSFLIILGVGGWKVKKIFWLLVHTSQLTKLIVFICVSLLSIFLIWRFRDKAGQWLNIVQERITPLVLLFGIFVMLSFPLVAYHTFFKEYPGKIVSQESSRSTAAGRNRPNIILVTFDAMTARDMSVYDYHRETTPFINEWAKSAYLFTKAQAESNKTTPSVASLMTGMRVWTHQTYHLKSRIYRSNYKNLAHLLKNNGYYNMAFVENPLASPVGLVIANSFNHVITISPKESGPIPYLNAILQRIFYGKIALYNWILLQDFHPTTIFLKSIYYPIAHRIKTKKGVVEPPELIFNAFEEFLTVIDNGHSEPFFAWIHLYPPHAFYMPSRSYIGMFDASPDLRTYEEQAIVMHEVAKSISKHGHLSQDIQPILETFRARYDEYIRNCDKEFEDFIKQLEKRDKLKNTAIILSSDHGESFEHDYFTHAGPHLYEQVTHVPLIIKEPNQSKGQIISNIVGHIDIPSTIIDLAGISSPQWMEGRSLVPLIHGKTFSGRPVFSMAMENNRSDKPITKGTISVWEGDYKLIHYIEDKKSLLFNLKQDPHELNDLFLKDGLKVGQHLLNLVQDNLKKANERISNKN